MKLHIPRPTALLALAAALSGALILAACGGGSGSGGGGGTTPPTGAGSTVELSGIAATGAAMSGATIIVTDKTAAEVQNCPSACTASASGAFVIPLKTGAQAPFVLKATPAGGGEPQVSVVAEATNTTVNITPITTMIAGRLSPNGDPSVLLATAFDAAKLKTALDEVVALIQPLLNAVGSTTNPLNGTFVADGTGLDRVLDSLNVSVQRNASGTAVIEVEVKVSGDDVQPPKIVIAPNTAPTSTVSSTNVNSSTVVASGVSVKLADLLARLQTCYNTPFAQRVNTNASPTFTISSTVCNQLFLGDNAATTTYKHNGGRIGQNGHFSGMYRDRGTTTLVYDNPVYEFTRGGIAPTAGDIVFTYHWKSSRGDENYENGVVRDVGGVLKFVGNQYDYDASIRPYIQNREYLQADSAAMSHDANGYNVFIKNHLDGSGNPLLHRVVVTTPTNRTMTLWPTAGQDGLRFKKHNSSVISGTSIIRMQWAFWNTGTGTHINGLDDLADLETGLIFTRDSAGNPQQFTDDQIKAIPNQGKWKYEFYLATNTTTVAAIQYHTTLSRAKTIGETKSVVWPRFTAATLANIRQDITGTFGTIPIANEIIDLTEPDGSAVWEVPTGAFSPTRIGATIDLNTVLYTDSTNFNSTVRSTQIRCTPASMADLHCNSNGTFVANSRLTFIDMTARSSRFVEQAKAYALYKRVP